MEQIQAFRQQKQLNEIIKIKINKGMKKNDFNKQQIKNMFINI